jgi:hypothetical protein
MSSSDFPSDQPSNNQPPSNAPSSEGFPRLARRELLAISATFGSAFFAAQGLISQADAAELAQKKPVAPTENNTPSKNRSTCGPSHIPIGCR